MAVLEKRVSSFVAAREGKMRLTILVLMFALTSGLGCASGTSVSGGQGSVDNVVTSQRLRQVQNQFDDMYMLLRNLRSNWLRSRGDVSIQDPTADEPRVFLDGSENGPLSSLRDLSPTDVGKVVSRCVGGHDVLRNRLHRGIIMVTSR